MRRRRSGAEKRCVRNFGVGEQKKCVKFVWKFSVSSVAARQIMEINKKA